VKCLDELKERVPHTEQGKLISIYWYFRKHLVFEVQPPRSSDLNPLDCNQCEHLITLLYSAIVKNRHFTNAFMIPVRPFATATGPFERCRSLWSDVSMRALIQVEGILSICC